MARPEAPDRPGALDRRGAPLALRLAIRDADLGTVDMDAVARAERDVAVEADMRAERLEAIDHLDHAAGLEAAAHDVAPFSSASKLWPFSGPNAARRIVWPVARSTISLCPSRVTTRSSGASAGAVSSWRMVVIP